MVKDIIWNVFPRNTKLTVPICVTNWPFQQRKIHRQGNMTFDWSAVLYTRFRRRRAISLPQYPLTLSLGRKRQSNTIIERWCQSNREISWKTHIELKPESLRRKRKIRNLVAIEKQKRNKTDQQLTEQNSIQIGAINMNNKKTKATDQNLKHTC